MKKQKGKHHSDPSYIWTSQLHETINPFYSTYQFVLQSPWLGNKGTVIVCIRVTAQNSNRAPEMGVCSHHRWVNWHPLMDCTGLEQPQRTAGEETGDISQGLNALPGMQRRRKKGQSEVSEKVLPSLEGPEQPTESQTASAQWPFWEAWVWRSRCTSDRSRSRYPQKEFQGPDP